MNLSSFKWDVDNCARCSMCKWVNPWEFGSSGFLKVCPAVARYLFDAYSCQGKMDIAKALIDGRVELKASEKLADIVYHCSLCGACDAMCKRSRDMEPLLVFKALREKLWEEGLAPEGLRKISKSVQDYGNVWLQPRNRRARWAKKFDLKNAAEGDVEVLFFAGCTYSYHPQFADVIQAMARLLDRANVKFGILGEAEVCCGSPVGKVGDIKQFEAIAAENISRFNSTGAGAVVTPCAGCYSTIKVDYAEVADRKGLDIKYGVLHITEYLGSLINKESIKPEKSLNMKVTYHDPCHLGRQSDPFIPWQGTRGAYGRCDPPKILRRGTHGCYEAPRDILRSIPGIELVEMDRNRENSWCCGAGGGVRTFDIEFARWSAGQRINEALSTGAEALVTSCPWCEQNLGEACGDRIAVRNIPELLFRSLEDDA